jgi:biopolymer transport protein ExbD/biopolymer transport protein TolR
MGMATGSGEGNLVADINVTPMVDVMLVLLIIFMIITPMLQQGVSVTLPQTKNPDIDPAINRETSAVVAIPNNNDVYLGKEKVRKEDLPDRINTLLKDKPNNERVVYIKSTDSVNYGTVVEVVDQIRNAGFDRIGLVSKKEKEQGADTGAPAPAK